MSYSFLFLKKITNLTVFIFPFLLTTMAFAEPVLHTKCGKETSPITWSYCVTETEGSNNKDVLYLFHGASSDLADGMTESWWVAKDSFKEVREIWARTGYEAPKVVEVSFGAVWLLVPQNKAPYSGLFDVFTQIVLPYIETNLLDGPVGNRKALGHSMGGLNAAFFAIQHSPLFQSIAMLAPALVGISPFATQEEIEAYAKSNEIPASSVNGLLKIALAFIDNEETWQALSPSVAAAKALSANSPPMYVSAGSEDTLFYAESQKFVQSARSAGAKVEWVPIPGGNHIEFHAESLARFLAK